jgi:hypothetical protein
MPCRACLHGLTRGFWKKYAPARLSNSLPPTPARRADSDDEEEHGPVEEEPLVPKPIGEKRGGDMTERKFVFLTTVILVCGFFIALVVDELEVGESRVTVTVAV